jgi:hypothetical protein
MLSSLWRLGHDTATTNIPNMNSGDRKSDDLDSLLREAGGLEGLAAQLGQHYPNEQQDEDECPNPGGVAPAQRIGVGVLRAVLASLARCFRSAHD